MDLTRQSRIESMAEVAINVVIGFTISMFAQLVIFPQYHIEVSMQANLEIGAWFTVVSIIRSYVLRRIFNRYGGPTQWIRAAHKWLVA